MRSAQQYILGHFAGDTGRRTDQPLVVLLQKFPVYARLVIEALGVRARRQHCQIAVTDLVLGEQDQVVVLISALGAGLVSPRGPRYIEFAADYRIYLSLFAFLIEFEGAEHVAVVCYCQAGHTEVDGALDETANAGGAVEKGVIGVDVEVDERHAGSISRPGRGGKDDGAVEIAGGQRFYSSALARLPLSCSHEYFK